MSYQRAYGKLTEFGSDVLVAGTRFLLERNWIKPPGGASTVGEGAFRYRVDRNWCKADPREVPVKNCHASVRRRQRRFSR